MYKKLIAVTAIAFAGCCPNEPPKPVEVRTPYSEGQSAGRAGLDRDLCPYPEREVPTSTWVVNETGARRSEWLSGHNAGAIERKAFAQ